MSEAIEAAAGSGSVKRTKRTADEKRRIVEATLIPGASIARVAREHGVNANQVFQWRYEYRKGTLTLWAGRVEIEGSSDRFFCGVPCGPWYMRYAG